MEADNNKTEEGRGSTKRKHRAKQRETPALAHFLCFIYASHVNAHCFYTMLMNVTQCAAFSEYMLRGIVPDEVYESDDSNDETRRLTERSFINVLVYHGYISGPNNSRNLPTDINIGEYVKYFDKRFGENIGVFENVIIEAKFLILFLQITYSDSGGEEFHFVSVVKFDDDWIVMGGEQRSEMCSIPNDELPNILFTEEGRKLILEHCQTPFGEIGSLDWHPGVLCLVPLHCGPTQRIDYTGMPEKQVKSIIPWPCLQTTSTRMQKSHGFVIKNIGDDIPKLLEE